LTAEKKGEEKIALDRENYGTTMMTDHSVSTLALDQKKAGHNKG